MKSRINMADEQTDRMFMQLKEGLLFSKQGKFVSKKNSTERCKLTVCIILLFRVIHAIM